MASSSPFRSNISTRSPRNSPFRRPESPVTRSPSQAYPSDLPFGSPTKRPDSIRHSSVSGSPNLGLRSSIVGKTSRLSSQPSEMGVSQTGSPSKSVAERASWIASRESSLLRSSPGPSGPRHSVSSRHSFTPSPNTGTAPPATNRPATPATSPEKGGSTPHLRATSPLKLKTSMVDPFAFIPPAQLQTMRESFAVLDRNSTGVITTADVADMLGQIGMEASPAVLAHFFPTGVKEMNLAGYLSVLAGPFADVPSQAELREAFAAFDDDDSGQIDVLQLRKALLSTPPDNGDAPLSEVEVDTIMHPFTGRRAFTRHRNASTENRGPVFKYNDFVNQIYVAAPNSGTPTGPKPSS